MIELEKLSKYLKALTGGELENRIVGNSAAGTVIWLALLSISYFNLAELPFSTVDILMAIVYAYPVALIFITCGAVCQAKSIREGDNYKESQENKYRMLVKLSLFPFFNVAFMTTLTLSFGMFYIIASPFWISGKVLSYITDKYQKALNRTFLNNIENE